MQLVSNIIYFIYTDKKNGLVTTKRPVKMIVASKTMNVTCFTSSNNSIDEVIMIISNKTNIFENVKDIDFDRRNYSLKFLERKNNLRIELCQR